MIEIKKKDKCCGCYGCANICPKACISMKVDNEGFWYPNVDIYKCINCDLCVNVCPVINSMKNNNVEIKAFACKNTDENVRFKSSSGGVFSLLCEYVIKLGGVVLELLMMRTLMLDIHSLKN
ncbi:4Fe-4S dicluster domain-containing protein [Clostridium perfringens]|nr:4Fe-4S dicluster domain-containing protein [Clostridium perfringens]